MRNVWVMDTGKRKYLPNPRENANILSVVVFAWIIPLFRKGYNKVLDLEDVLKPLDVDTSECLGQRLEMWVKNSAFEFLYEYFFFAVLS